MISERSFVRSFGSFWSEQLPLLTPRFMTIFNEAYVSELESAPAAILISDTADGEMERRDIVAEFAFRLARLTYQKGLSHPGDNQVLIDAAASEAFELINRYEGTRPTELIPLSPLEMRDGLALFERYQALYKFFPAISGVEFCPKFSGAGFISTCEGDLSINDILIEIKTTTRKPSMNDIRQLITYLALGFAAGNDKWARVAIFNPRRATIHLIDIDVLIRNISGGKHQIDVFTELISFAESFPFVRDHAF